MPLSQVQIENFSALDRLLATQDSLKGVHLGKILSQCAQVQASINITPAPDSSNYIYSIGLTLILQMKALAIVSMCPRHTF